MATAERHIELSDRLLSHAHQELEKGDTIQAAEKAWGSVAHYIKFEAVERGWPNKSHRNLLDNFRRLLGGTSDYGPNLLRLSAVQRLHQNFYEDDLDADEVGLHIEAAQHLLDALRAGSKRLA